VSILDLDSDENFIRTITKEEVYSPTVDKELMKDVIVEMRRYDRLIGYYASNMRFDIPFLRTRAVHHSLHFPEFGEIIMEDLYPVIKNKFKLSRNRLDNACEALLGKSHKTHWLWRHWLKAIQGNQESLDYITDHCKRDTSELKRLYKKIYKFSKKGGASL
jgi:DNA polymerase elongation subunit (family B)